MILLTKVIYVFYYLFLIFQYDFNWEVNEREAKTDGAFFTHTESKKEDTPTRTEGEYRTWLPDGR